MTEADRKTIFQKFKVSSAEEILSLYETSSDEIARKINAVLVKFNIMLDTVKTPEELAEFKEHFGILARAGLEREDI